MDGIVTAIFGLVGVLVGGVITGISNWRLVVRKERTDAAKEAVIARSELLRAARLTSLDLQKAYSAIYWAREHRDWWQVEVIITEGWIEYRRALAPVLSDLEWFKVVVSFNSIENLRRMYNSYSKEDMNEGMLEQLEKDHQFIKDGISTLEPYALTNPSTRSDKGSTA